MKKLLLFTGLFLSTSCMKKIGTIPERNPDAIGRYISGRSVGLIDMNNANKPLNELTLDKYIESLCKGNINGDRVIGYKIDRFSQETGSQSVNGIPLTGNTMYQDIEAWCGK